MNHIINFLLQIFQTSKILKKHPKCSFFDPSQDLKKSFKRMRYLRNTIPNID